MRPQAWRSEAATHLQDVLTEALRGDGIRVVAVDPTDGGAVVTFLVDDDPRLLGRVVPWDDVEDDDVTPADWARDEYMYLLPWTTHWSRRIDRGAYIELTDEDLPADHRFTISALDEGDDGWWLRAQRLDTAPALAAREQGRLLAWLTASVDSRTGEPVVAQATVVRVDEVTARIETFDVHDRAPVTVVLDLALAAASRAARAGLERLVIAPDRAGTGLLGFRPGPSGDLVLDLALLDVDADAWHVLLAEATRSPLPRDLLRGPGTWRQRLVRRLTTRTRVVVG